MIKFKIKNPNLINKLFPLFLQKQATQLKESANERQGRIGQNLQIIFGFLTFFSLTSCQTVHRDHLSTQLAPYNITKPEVVSKKLPIPLTFVDPQLLANLQHFYCINHVSLKLSGSELAAARQELARNVVKSIFSDLGINSARESPPERSPEIEASPALPSIEPRERPSPEIVGRRDLAPLEGTSLEIEASPALPSIEPRERPFPETLRRIDLATFERFSFLAQEEIALITLPRDHPLLSSLQRSANNSIIRGTTEFRLRVENISENLAEIVAFDLRLKTNKEEITLAMNARLPYIPKTTYRSDPLFSLKTEAVKRLGANGGRQPLEEGLTGTLFDADHQSPIDFEVKKILGNGTHGKILQVDFLSENGQSFSLAIKQPVHWSGSFGIEEVVLLDGMAHHPNGVQFFGCYPLADGRRNALAMEVMSGDWASPEVSAFSFEEKTRLMIGAADSLAALHERANVHKDIFAKNLFFLRETVGAHEVVAKLGDFGSSGQEYQPGLAAFDVLALGQSMIQLRAGRKITWATPVGSTQFKQFLNLEIIKNDEIKLLHEMIDIGSSSPISMKQVAARLREIYQLDNM